MAKEEKVNADDAPPKKSKKIIIIAVAGVLLLLLLAAGGAYFMTQSGEEHEDEDEVAEASEKPKKKKGEKEAPPVYIPMDTFTVNLVPDNGEQYLQVAISVEAVDAATAEQLKLYMPRLRHEITDILSSKKPSEVATREGKKTLAEEIRTAINAVVDTPPAKGKKTGNGPVKAVLFTTFIVQ